MNFVKIPFLIRICLSLLLVFSFTGCGEKQEEGNEDSNTSAIVEDVPESAKRTFREKTTKIRANLIGKTIESLDKLLSNDETEQGGQKLFFYFSASDCASCLTKGTNAVKGFSSINQETEIIAILKGSYFARQVMVDFPNYIHDESYFIDDELGYIPTPAIIRSLDNEILDIYMIPTFLDSIRMNEFLKEF